MLSPFHFTVLEDDKINGKRISRGEVELNNGELYVGEWSLNTGLKHGRGT